MCDCTDHKDEIPVYDAQAIESRWMKAWEDSNLFAVDTDDSKPKKYVLEMFPYPSGDLHMGHARNYTIGDAMARQARMRGYDVLHPIGFDAFGLPAENAAIKHNTQAAAWTYKNMDQALATMKRMGFSYDLDRMVKTCSPDYYRWGQWIFEKMWEKGLVYRKKNPVNWCPTCKTVLANEQVTEGKCWRCGTEPEKRDLEQWYYKITEYSQELLDDLEKLPGWPERVKQMQANWIGRSEGAEVDFTLCDQDGEPIEGDEGKISVFTTRADTLFGTTYMVISPEHPLLKQWQPHIANWDAVAAYIDEAAHKSDFERGELNKEKTGVRLEGIEAILKEAEATDLKIYFVVPSHVPFSPNLETSGGRFNPEIIRKALKRPDAVGLSECVGPYITAGFPDLLESFDTTLSMPGKTLQGHLPDMYGPAMSTCIAAGVSTCLLYTSPSPRD